jgi:predicted aspartyl protease
LISGVVTPDREAIVRVYLQPSSGPRYDLEAVVDTGFAGYLTLPAAVIASLGYRLGGRAQVILGDGSMIRTDVFFGAVL